MVLENVLHVPSIATSLLSVRAITRKGGVVTFVGVTLKVLKDGKVVATGSADGGGQYLMDVHAKVPAYASVAYGEMAGKGRLWHRRYSHLATGNLAKLPKIVKGTDIKATDANQVEGATCRPCIEARMTRSPHDGEGWTATEPLDLLNVDLAGPVTPTSQGGANHVLKTTDGATGLRVVSLLKTKAEAGAALRATINELEKAKGKPVKRMRSDGAGELVKSVEMVAFYQSKGIKTEPTLPYSPESNGVAERLNRTLFKRTRAVLFDAKADKNLWGEAIKAVAHTINLAPTKEGKSTPQERFYGSKPDVSHLRVWGSMAYALKPPSQQRKLDSRVLVGTHVGYAAGGHGLRILSPVSGRILERRDVIVDETVREERLHGAGLPTLAALPSGWGADTGSSPGSAGGPSGGGSDKQSVETSASSSGSEPVGSASESGPLTRYELRPRAANAAGAPNGAANMATATPPAGGPLTVEEKMVRPGWDPKPPATYEAAMARPNAWLWKKAMDEEMAAHESRGTWDLKDAPPGTHITSSKWAYDYKRNAAGEINRYRAHFCVRGFTQLAGIDYEEVYAPCPSKATVRAVRAVVALRYMEAHTLDGKNAYLNAQMTSRCTPSSPRGTRRDGPARSASSSWPCTGRNRPATCGTGSCTER